eukprot:gb/GECG01001308.1/.p1 GENE.gb/GECG01001308.1/~~gb/GECG01001308.1/.p1  ORF type:complete len:791 (+),score=72.85 gb/GECG01001308.1/:1-2373(+)
MAAKLKDGLFLGDYESAQDLEFIIANKITHIINCVGREVPNSWERTGVKYLTFSWPESGNCVIFDENNAVLDDIYAFVEEAHEHAESILIHSIDGASRAAFCAAVYFMLKYRWTLNKTLGYLQSKRPDLCPKPGFMRQLRALDASLQRVARGSKKSATETRRYFDWDPEILSADQARQNGARPGDYDHDELLLANTYLNSQAQVDPKQLRSMTANGRMRRDRARSTSRRRVQWIDDPSRKNTSHNDVPRSPRTHRPTTVRPPTPSYNAIKPAEGWSTENGQHKRLSITSQNSEGSHGSTPARPQSAYAALTSILKNSAKWKEAKTTEKHAVAFASSTSKPEEASMVSQVSISTDQSAAVDKEQRGHDGHGTEGFGKSPRSGTEGTSGHKANKYHIPPTPPIQSEEEGLGDEGFRSEKSHQNLEPILQVSHHQSLNGKEGNGGFLDRNDGNWRSNSNFRGELTFPGTDRHSKKLNRPHSSSANIGGGRPPKALPQQQTTSSGEAPILQAEGISKSSSSESSSGLFRSTGSNSGDNVLLPQYPQGATAQRFVGGEAAAALTNHRQVHHAHRSHPSNKGSGGTHNGHQSRPSTSDNEGRSRSRHSNPHSHKRYATPPPRQWSKQERQSGNHGGGFGSRPSSASVVSHAKSQGPYQSQLYLSSGGQADTSGAKQDPHFSDFWPLVGKQNAAPSNRNTSKVRTGGKLQQQHPIRVVPMPQSGNHGPSDAAAPGANSQNQTGKQSPTTWRPQCLARNIYVVGVPHRQIGGVRVRRGLIPLLRLPRGRARVVVTGLN